MHIDEGAWIDYKGFRLWIHGVKDMNRVEILKEANEIIKSGWMSKNMWLPDAVKDKVKK